ncbi:NAD(P)H-quinone dehydrogenase [Demequina aurantiaca]|uniref:NAD(P)H-quinone dehydrogenase n=1 Tax=Demequina aurantiaca TaxID=676200 RepID=UPI003D345E3F
MASRIVIIGGGPGGYEAAIVARKQGAEVTLIERQGLGGNAVLTDVVPSKTVIATAEWRTIADRAPSLGIRAIDGSDTEEFSEHEVDMAAVNQRISKLVLKQSHDIATRMAKNDVQVVEGSARLLSPTLVETENDRFEADAVLLALGARPRTLSTCEPDGERILTWTQLYDLKELPEHLIVVGSGVTGAEFAGAYCILGSEVTLISSGDRVLENQDPEASALITEVFAARGMNVIGRSRASAAVNTGNGVEVTLSDGTVIEGSHCLMAVGSIPNTADAGLEEAGVNLNKQGFIEVDRVSRTSARGVYAAGDCTGVFPLASVAATQGRIAMAHILGDAVAPLDLGSIAANVFTTPEIASVGATEKQLQERGIFYQVSRLDLARNPRAKMLGIDQGFVKIFGHTVTGQVLGAVIVGSRAGEHIFPLSLAVSQHLTVDNIADAFTVYPSLSGTIAEAARRLHNMTDPQHAPTT